jgi:hypothetical protein
MSRWFRAAGGFVQICTDRGVTGLEPRWQRRREFSQRDAGRSSAADCAVQVAEADHN